jgi:hypothetical protein
MYISKVCIKAQTRQISIHFLIRHLAKTFTKKEKKQKMNFTSLWNTTYQFDILESFLERWNASHRFEQVQSLPIWPAVFKGTIEFASYVLPMWIICLAVWHCVSGFARFVSSLFDTFLAAVAFILFYSLWAYVQTGGTPIELLRSVFCPLLREFQMNF